LFLSNGASQIFSGQGVNFNPRTTGVFSQISGGSADNNTSSILNSFAKNFGDAASLLAQESLSAADAIKILPNILLEIRSSEALGGTGNFLTRLGQSLEDAGIGKAISDTIVAKATDIIGPEGKDSIILERLSKDFLNTLDEFTKNLTERNQNIFSELESSTIANLKQFSDGLINASKSLSNIQERTLKTVDNQRVLQSVISSVTGRSDFRAERQLDQRRQNIITGGRTSDQLLQDLRSAISGEGQLRDELGQTQDLEQQKRLVSSINFQQNAAARAGKALEELANVTSRTSTAQRQLAEATKDRLTRRDLAIQTITANPRELAEQNRTVELSRFAIAQSLQGNDVTQVIKPDDLKNVVSFLQKLGDTTIGGLGGLSGNKGLDAILNAQFKAGKIGQEGILIPDKNELKLVTEIERITKEANKIEIDLANLESTRRNEFINNLDTNFNKFITDLKTQINRVFENEANTRVAAIEGDINTRKQQLDVADNIRGITGIDTQTVLSNFKQIKELVNKTKATTSSKENISDLLNNPESFQKAVADSFKTGDVTGEGILKNLFSQIKDQNTLETVNQLLRKGDFKDVLNRLNSNIEGAKDPSNRSILSQSGLSSSLQKSLQEPLKQFIEKTDKELLSLDIDRKSLALSVGGDDNLLAIESNIKTLTPLIAKFPDGTQIKTLSDEVERLTLELKQIKVISPLGRNSGGMIPGYGTKDTVPAMLTEGEYVVKAPSVRKYGKAMMDQINSGNFQGFNKGGLVKDPLDFVNMDGVSRKKYNTGILDTISSFLFDPIEMPEGMKRGVDSINKVAFGKNGILDGILDNFTKFTKFAEKDVNPALLDIPSLLGFSPPKVRDIGVGAFGDPEIHSLMYDSARYIASNLRQQQGLTLKEQREQKLLDSGLPFPSISNLVGNFTGLPNDEAQALQLRRARQANQAMYDFNVADRGDGGLGGNFYKDEIKRIKEETNKKISSIDSFIKKNSPEKIIPQKSESNFIPWDYDQTPQQRAARIEWEKIQATKGIPIPQAEIEWRKKEENRLNKINIQQDDLSDSKESIKLISDPNVIKNITKEQLQVFASKFKFPQSIMDDLVKYGVSVKQSGSVTNIDKDLLTKSPRGQSGTFDDIKGLYRNTTKQILLRNDAKPEVLIHELGHAFDYFKGTITDQNDFIASYGSDVQRMPQVNKDQIKYLLQEGSAGRRETFATIFDDVITKRGVMSGYFPSTTKLVSDLMKKSEIEHLHQDYKDIVSARNVENPNYKMLVRKNSII